MTDSATHLWQGLSQAGLGLLQGTEGLGWGGEGRGQGPGLLQEGPLHL